jgi:hypothetical protein
MYRLALGRWERELLLRLLVELRELIEEDDPGVARLFPAAYRDDPEASAEYDRLVHGELAAGRLAALQTVERTLEAKTLDDPEVEAWTGVLNDLRLVHGERLAITEELDLARLARRDERYAVYAWLTWLQATMVDELASRLG